MTDKEKLKRKLDPEYGRCETCRLMVPVRVGYFFINKCIAVEPKNGVCENWEKI